MPRKKEVQEHYDGVASLYDQRDVTYPHVRAELFKNLSLRKNEVVLDVGCGTGKFLLDLGRNSCSVVGVDVSSEMLRKNYCQIRICPNIYLVCCDGEFLPFRRAVFDKITCIEVIEHIEKPRKLLNEMERILKTDGGVFLTTPNALWSTVLHIAEKIGMKVTEGPTKHFFPQELRRLIGISNLRIEHFKGTIFFPRKAWRSMEILSEALNKLRLQDLCLKQIIILRRGFR